MAAALLSRRTYNCFSQQSSFQTTLKMIATGARHFNSHRSSIARIGRQAYTRMYPTLLVQPDGSTYTIRYHIPQRIIKLPVDISQLSEEEQKLQMLKRKPKQKLVIQEEIEDDFDSEHYSHLWKK